MHFTIVIIIINTLIGLLNLFLFTDRSILWPQRGFFDVLNSNVDWLLAFS